MITLLMALFMVLFSISSVNTSKFESLQRAMQDAFSGKILSRRRVDPADRRRHELGAGRPRPPPIPAIQAIDAAARRGDSRARPPRKENEDFKALKQQIDAYAKEHGLEDKLETTIARRGLVVRLLTDNVLFDSGSATLNPAREPAARPHRALLQSDVRPPDRRRGPHRRPRRSRAPQFPTQLGAVGRPRDRRRPILDPRPRRRRPPRGLGYGATAPDHHERDGRRPRAQPPRRDRPDASDRPRPQSRAAMDGGPEVRHRQGGTQ